MGIAAAAPVESVASSKIEPRKRARQRDYGMKTRPSLYDADYLAWTQAQADALREGRLDALDVPNLIEEIEDLGRSERRAVQSNLEQTLLHLLKWDYQAERRTRSWYLTIVEHRQRVRDALAESPSLHSKLPEVLPTAYRLARIGAARETGLPLETFPLECPWPLEDVLNRELHDDALAREFPAE